MEPDFLNSILNFNDQVAAFNPQDMTAGESNIYKTSPKLSKSDDCHYHSVVRVLYNPWDLKNSIIEKISYAFTDSEGYFSIDSRLMLGDRNCPVFKAWKQFRYSTDPAEQAKAIGDSAVFDRRSARWVLVQVIEDDNQPELVGKFRLFKLPKAIFDMLQMKMNPSAESKKTPKNVMDYLVGCKLNIDVTPGPDDKAHPERLMREIKYTASEFDDSEACPIIKIDGTPLFTEEETADITALFDACNKVHKEKTDAKKEAAKKEAAAIYAKIKPLYERADAYIKENGINVAEEMKFKEMTPDIQARFERWLKGIKVGIDPKLIGISGDVRPAAETAAKPETQSAPSDGGDIDIAQQLPF